MAELDPRLDRPSDPKHDGLRDRWRDAAEDTGYGYVGPIIALALLFLIGLFIFGNWGTSTQTGTQVGQNVERPSTPAPRPAPNQ